jgi:hypothetical protein
VRPDSAIVDRNGPEQAILLSRIEVVNLVSATGTFEDVNSYERQRAAALLTRAIDKRALHEPHVGDRTDVQNSPT